MPIALLNQTLSTVDANLAFDEAMLLAAEVGGANEGGECLRFWEWPTHAVVLGAGGSIAIDVDEAACRADGVSLHRRASGGGTVLLGRGCLLFSLVLAYTRAPELRDVRASYRWILDRVRDALRPVAHLEAIGISDLAMNGRKVSGNSQQRKARYLLHHGTLLYDFDLEAFGRCLNPPEREPDYRAGRTHLDFVANLASGADELQRMLANEFEAEPGNAALSLARVPDLIEERYGKVDWVRRR